MSNVKLFKIKNFLICAWTYRRGLDLYSSFNEKSYDVNTIHFCTKKQANKWFLRMFPGPLYSNSIYCIVYKTQTLTEMSPFFIIREYSITFIIIIKPGNTGFSGEWTRLQLTL